jgi:hypothetical protein
MTRPTPPEGYYADSKGRHVPARLVKETDRLEDQTVETIVGFARPLSAQIARFKAHTFEDIAAFKSLLAEKYGAKCGGPKGNLTLTSYDGCLKVQVQIADQIAFGPQLQTAKSLIDQCITAWSDGSRDEIKALVDHAFQVSKEGAINMDSVLGLRRLEIDDPVWISAMTAISDAIRIVGSKTYLRISERDGPDDKWRLISIDMASVPDVVLPTASDADQIPVIAETTGAGEPS